MTDKNQGEGVHFAPGDRVDLTMYEAGKRRSVHRIATVTATGPDGVTIRLGGGRELTVNAANLALLPPSTRPARNGGRKPSTLLLRVGDVLAVCERTADGATLFQRYVVSSVEDTTDGARCVLSGDGVDLVVVR